MDRAEPDDDSGKLLTDSIRLGLVQVAASNVQKASMATVVVAKFMKPLRHDILVVSARNSIIVFT